MLNDVKVQKLLTIMTADSIKIFSFDICGWEDESWFLYCLEFGHYLVLVAKVIVKDKYISYVKLCFDKSKACDYVASLWLLFCVGNQHPSSWRYCSPICAFRQGFQAAELQSGLQTRSRPQSHWRSGTSYILEASNSTGVLFRTQFISPKVLR